MRILFLLSFCVSSISFCLPLGNPSEPLLIKDGFIFSSVSPISVRIGYLGDYVYDLKLKPKSDFSNKIDKFDGFSNFGTIYFNFRNRLDLFGNFGSSKISSSWRTQNNTYNIDVSTKNSFCFRAGGIVTLFEWGNSSIGFGGLYSRAKPKISSGTKNGQPLNFDDSKVFLKQWQIDLAFSYKIDIFIPYIGIKYSRNHVAIIAEDYGVITAEDSNKLYLENKENIGFAVGCSFTNSKLFMLNIEARFFDEEAASISGEIRF